jgi:hypothetical protein
MFIVGLVPFVRFAVLAWFTDDNGGSGRHIQSLVLGSVIVIAAVVIMAMGVIAELIRINRSLLEDSLEQQKRLFSRTGAAPDGPVPTGPPHHRPGDLDRSGDLGAVDGEDGGGVMLGRPFEGPGQLLVADRAGNDG